MVLEWWDLGSFGEGYDGEHSGSSFVEISTMFVMLDVFFVETLPFDRV